MVPITGRESRAEKMSNKDTSHVEHGVVGTGPCLGGFYSVPYVNYCIKSSVSPSLLSFQVVQPPVTLEESSESLLCCRYPKHKGCMQSQKSSLMKQVFDQRDGTCYTNMRP